MHPAAPLTLGVNLVAFGTLIVAMNQDLQRQQVTNRVYQLGILGTLFFSLFGGWKAVVWTASAGTAFFVAGLLQQELVGWGEADTAAFAMLGFGSLHLSPIMLLLVYIVFTASYAFYKVAWQEVGVATWFQAMDVLQGGDLDAYLNTVEAQLLDVDFRIAFVPCIAVTYNIAVSLAVIGIV